MIRQRPKGTTVRPTGAAGITTASAAATATTTTTSSSGTANTTPSKSSHRGTDDGGRHVTISFDQAPKTRIVASSLASSRRRNTKAATAAAGHHQHQQRHHQLQQQPHVVIVMDHHSFHHYPSQLMAPTPKPPRMILDKEYKDYLAGSIMTTQRKGQVIFTPFCAAKTCSYVSLVGTMFLFWVHMLIQRQPIFIKGVFPKDMVYSTGDYRYPLLPASESALHAAWAYLITMMTCMAFMYHTKRRRHYRDIPDAATTTATTASSNTTTSMMDALPIFHTQDRPSSFWTLMWFRVKQAIGTTTTPTKKRRGKDN